MVANGSRDRLLTSSATSTTTKQRVSSAKHGKKKTAKPIGICGFCLGNNQKNAIGVSEEMINCAECGNSGHPSCLQYSNKLVENIRAIRWQCIDCKRCLVCQISDDSLLFCDLCDSGIHPKCCDPPLTSIPKGDFVCHLCKNESTSSTCSRRSNDDHSSTVQREENDLLAKNLLASSKVQRIKKHLLLEDLPSNLQTSTPLLKRQLSNKKLIPIELVTSTPRANHQSDVQLNEDLNRTVPSRSATKRKHSANSISPTSTNSSTVIKKRAKTKQKECQSDDVHWDDDKQTKRKVPLNLSKYKNVPSFLHDPLPDSLTENDIYLFLDSRQHSTQLIIECSEKFHHSSECIDDDSTNTRWPPYIVFGSDLIKTWYSSSYPQEYARVPRLYICEFCLKYIKCEQVYDRHRKQCTVFHPPANEIYHKDDLSVFEVDGNINRIYCQNLCLLAKLFLDHKTLYYDVEPFLFYVLTKNDSNGCHFLGYFSKEKHCPQKYNLSCITVLPRCQRRGYGRFLIEFSYLLSQKEGQVGTPERPLSTLGAQTYEAYWRIRIVEQLIIYYYDNKGKCLLKSMMNETAMAADDIIETLQNLGVLTLKSNEKPVITADIVQLETIMKNEKIKHAHWVSIDSEYLRFTPVMSQLLLSNEEKAVEKQVKEIQIVFKELDREAAEAADDSNPNEAVRYIRRRKFGQKRRSILVKRRTPTNNKSLKTQTNDDRCTADLISYGDDEHSQEYVPRRRVSTINEPIKEEEEEETNPFDSLSPKLSQFKLDQFIKFTQPSTTSTNEINLSPTETNRIIRHTRLHSTSDPMQTETLKIGNHQESSSDQRISIFSSNDSLGTKTLHSSPVVNTDRPIPLKRRSLTSSNIQVLIDETYLPSKHETDQQIISTQESEILSSTLSDILANPLFNSIEEPTTIVCIESELKTLIDDREDKEICSIQPVQSVDDELPPSLTSPTSLIISQSNHYNYPTKSKDQPINPPVNLNNNFDETSYYYPSTTPMDCMPYYPSSSSPAPVLFSDSSTEPMYMNYDNGTTSFVQSSSTASTTLEKKLIE